MLRSLTIQNIVLIEQLTIEFEDGLCALTGETGAGKSILLDSLGLALGERSETRLVRKGAEKAQVVAVFEFPQKHAREDGHLEIPACAGMLQGVLAEADINIAEGEDIILRRSLNIDGRSKAFINDQPVSVSLLKQVGEALVEIHGQFETRGLLNPATHLSLLDEYAGVDQQSVATPFYAWKTEKQKLQELQDEAQASQAEEEFLRGSLEDLDALDPKEGEEEELAQLRERLMNREQVLEELNAAYHALNGESDPVRTAMGAVDRVAGKIGAESDEILAALDRASNEMQEAVALISSLSSDLQESEHNLESIDDRLFGLRGQARKHDCAVDELPAKRAELAERLNRIEHADDLLVEQARKVEQAKQTYTEAAEKVRAQRQKAAQALDKAVAGELPPLKMEKARFITQIDVMEEERCNETGMDQVRFLVATNPGADPGPLGKIASGGEMSRFMLALKVVMAQGGGVPTMIFDEVDAGIGGGTADAVGERLARLGQARQVLVVTHSPQVAARASHQWIVQKSGEETVTTDVVKLENGRERREEIARMLAGAEVTVEARAAAEKLLEKAA